MAERYTINMITPDTKDWTCKVQVVDKSRPRDNKDKTTKYQVLILQDEETATRKRIQEFIIMDKLPSTKTATGKLIQEFIIMDKLIKTIETKLVSYRMKSTTPIGSIMLIPFEDEVIYVANIQAQPLGQVFNVEAELSLASKDQRFSVLACSNCKQLFTSYNVRREIYCTSCHRSTHLIPRCQFEVTIKDNNGFATAIVSDEIAEKMLHLTSEEIYEISFVKVILIKDDPENPSMKDASLFV
ncbi:hypothetical protein KY289_032275 [Solanum tuberosum]|nr:hypothetical protein KY289_032275 [Solanum tuberosum]